MGNGRAAEPNTQKALLKRPAKHYWLVLAALALGHLASRFLPAPSLPKALLPDGRILQIEGITFGINHQIGSGSKIMECTALVSE